MTRILLMSLLEKKYKMIFWHPLNFVERCLADSQATTKSNLPYDVYNVNVLRDQVTK